MIKQESLWGAEFAIEDNTKEVLDKVANQETNQEEISRILKSKKTNIIDKLKIIKDEVYRVLGRYIDDVITIRDKDTLVKYIDHAIKNGVIAIDTETNNSLDPITCKIMGGCIYTPGEKAAYIPINHTTLDGDLLENQLTEQDLKEQFDRLKDTKIIMHNAKFDYEVILCTCNCDLDIYWDTLIAAKLIDENEPKYSLKYQYSKHIDPTQEAYDIEHLFMGVKYAVVDPELFALYSARDAYDTYKLYEYQKDILEQPDNQGVYRVFREVETPLTKVLAKMELTGININVEYAKRLHNKYQKMLDEIDSEISKELVNLQPKIDEWLKTDDANVLVGGSVHKKPKKEQLTNPINLSSSTQMAIVFYDILKVPQINKDKPRSTDKATLDEIADRFDIPLAKLKKKRGGIKILLDTFIDALPAQLSTKDNKIHCEYQQYGAKTGRLSCSAPMQNWALI